MQLYYIVTLRFELHTFKKKLLKISCQQCVFDVYVYYSLNQCLNETTIYNNFQLLALLSKKKLIKIGP